MIADVGDPMEGAAAPMLAFSTDDASRLTGLSPRRLQYWDETDFIRPSVAARMGRGSPRLYSFTDLVQLRVAAQLRDLVSLQCLRRLRSVLDVDSPFASVRFGVTPTSEVVYIGPAGKAEAVRHPGQITMTFDVPLRDIRSDLETRVKQLRERRRGVGKVERARGTLAGQERVAGTRIGTAAVRRLVAAGWSHKQILDEYPEIRPADIAAAIATRKAG